MRRKDIPAAKNFLTVFALNNFERGTIDSPRIVAFNRFLAGLTDKVAHGSIDLTIDCAKTVTELVVGFAHNLRFVHQRPHTFAFLELLRFYQHLTTLFLKIVTAWNSNEKIASSDLLSMLTCFLYDEIEPRCTEIEAKTDILSSLSLLSDETAKIKMHFELPLAQILYFQSISGYPDLAGKTFIAFLHKATGIEDIKQWFMTYLMDCISGNHPHSFKRALTVFQHMGHSSDLRRSPLDKLLFSALDHNHFLIYINELNKVLPISRLLTQSRSLLTQLKLIDKIISKANLSQSIATILEELAKLQLEIIPEEYMKKLDSRLSQMPAEIINWLASLQGRQLTEQIVEADIKDQKLIGFVKKLNPERIQQVEKETSSKVLGRISRALTAIFKKWFRLPGILEKIRKININNLACLKNDRATKEFSEFALEIIPHLIAEWAPNPTQKSSILYGILVRRATLQAEKSNGSELYQLFRNAFFQMIQRQSLNYHYLLAFIFLRHTNLQDRTLITDFLIEEINREIAMPQASRSCRNLLLQLSLFLKCQQNFLSVHAIKYKVRQLIKLSDLLQLPLNPTTLLYVNPKDLMHSRPVNDLIPTSWKTTRDKIADVFEGYGGDYISLFYQVIIQFNSVMQTKGESNSVLNSIIMIRKISNVEQPISLLELLTQYLKGRTQQHHLLLLVAHRLKNADLTSIREQLDTSFTATYLGQLALKFTEKLDYQLLIGLLREQSKQDSLLQHLNNNEIMQYYPQAMQDRLSTRILLIRTFLSLRSQLLELIGTPQPNIDLMRPLYLLFLGSTSPAIFNFTEHDQNLANIFLQMHLLVENIRKGQSTTQNLQKLSSNLSSVSELALIQHSKQYLNGLHLKWSINFAQLSAQAIINALTNSNLSVIALSKFIFSLVEYDSNQNCACCKVFVSKALADKIETPNAAAKLIIQRVKVGLKLIESDRNQFLQHSRSSYELIRSLFDGNESKLGQLVQDIIQLDQYNDCEQSGYLLREIGQLFSPGEEKPGFICESVFNYVLTLADIFPGEEKLEVSTFICGFFELAASTPERDLDVLEKTANLTCNNNATYKCLKCDEKRLFCLGCAAACHKDHPVCYLQLPPELRTSKCQCREIPGGSCKHSPKDREEANRDNLFARQMGLSGFPPIISNYHPALLGAPSPDVLQRIKYFSAAGNRPPREIRERDMREFMEPERIELGAFLQEEMEHEFKGGWREGRLPDMDVPKNAMRVDRLFNRDEYPGYRQFEGRHINPVSQPNQNKQTQEEDEPEWSSEIYSPESNKMDEQIKLEHDGPAVLQKQVLLPKFIELMVSFCSRRGVKSGTASNASAWKIQFQNPAITRLNQSSIRLCGPGSYSVELRKQNPIHNVSCVIIRKSIAQSQRWITLSSGNEIIVFAKDKFLLCGSELKILPSFCPVHKHALSYQIHSLQFGGEGGNVLCAAGLHNVAIMSINSEGIIARSNLRYSVSNLYINKIKLAKMGIFVGIEKEIRVINYACKHILTIKAQQANTLIREWAIFEKAAGCQVYFVDPNGGIFSVDLLPNEEGKKEFTGKVTDTRKVKSGTGATVYVKDLPEMGKYLFASFKDGSNIIGRLEGDIVEDMANLQLKGIKCDRNLLDSNFIMGHVDMLKIPGSDEVYVVCTLKKYFPPEMSFHQGYLTLFRLKKDGSSEILFIYDEATCEHFQVLYVGPKHFLIISLHSDGSLILSAPFKLPRAVAEEQARKIIEADSGAVASDGKAQNELINKMRASISKLLKLQKIINRNINSSLTFRDNSDALRIGNDYSVIRAQPEYQFVQNNFSRIMTGFSLPYFGTVVLPTRTITSTFQVGLTTLEALYFYSQGNLKFTYKPIEPKIAREHLNMPNPRIMERIDRMERLNEYPEERIFNSGLMASILAFKQDINHEITFVGRSVDSFRSRIPRFDQFFGLQQEEDSGGLEKTALILRMFLQRGLQEGCLCAEEELTQLVASLQPVLATAPKKLYSLLRELVILSGKIYERQVGHHPNLQTQQLHGLRSATETRLQHYYGLLRLDIGDEQLSELLDLLLGVLRQDVELMGYYVAKYAGIFTLLNRRLRKPDNEERAIALVEIYAFAYPVLKYCDISSAWLTTAINNMLIQFLPSRNLREQLYKALILSNQLQLQPWLRTLGTRQVTEVVENKPVQMKEQARDPMTQIYNMYNRGQIDDEALIRMIQDATKIQFEKEQEGDYHEVPQQDMKMQQEKEMEMQAPNKYPLTATLLLDLIDECTESFGDNYDTTISRILSLYVVSRAIDDTYPEVLDYLLEKIKKMVTEIDLKAENQKLTYTALYCSLFHQILQKSKTLTDKGGQNYPPCKGLIDQVNNKLSQLQLESIPKSSSPPKLMGRIFKGDKRPFTGHIAYSLASLLLFPCHPSHVLLSLECYWLLPEPREYYARQKDLSSIKDGVESGNLQKVLDIATANPRIWQQAGYLQKMEQWVEQQRSGWQIALELLAIYYQS